MNRTREEQAQLDAHMARMERAMGMPAVGPEPQAPPPTPMADVLPGPQPIEPEIVRQLRDLLAQAERGELVGFVAVLMRQAGGSREVGWRKVLGSLHDHLEAMGMLRVLEARLVQSVDPVERETVPPEPRQA